MELDLRAVREPDRQGTVSRVYEALPVYGSVVLVADTDGAPWRAALDVEHPGSCRWETLEEGPGTWRIHLTKLASTPLPRVLCDTALVVASAEPDAAGALWKLPMRQRDLDSNVVQIPPGEAIDAHVGADLDVLVLVLHGAGRLGTELGEVDVRAGELLWLPRGSQRSFSAGEDGLRYLTVHQRRQALGLVAGRS